MLVFDHARHLWQVRRPAWQPFDGQHRAPLSETVGPQRREQKHAARREPAREILEGMGLVIAGALLLTPGFFTDAVGFFLLFPPTRIWLVSRIASRMVVSSTVNMHGYQARDDDVIDGVKFHREDESSQKLR